MSIYTRVLCYRWSYPIAAFYMSFGSGLSVSGICHYIEEHCEKLIGHLDAAVAITVEQF